MKMWQLLHDTVKSSQMVRACVGLTELPACFQTLTDTNHKTDTFNRCTQVSITSLNGTENSCGRKRSDLKKKANNFITVHFIN